MLRTILSMGLVQLIGMIIGIARSKIFAVLLGPAGFGVVATIDQLVMSSIQVLNLSLPFTALKFLSRDHSLGEAQFRQSYAGFLKMMMSLALVATVLTLVLVPANLARLDAQLALYRIPVIIALLGIPATLLLMFLVNVLAARQQGVWSVVLTVISAGVILLAGGIGCMVGGIPGIYLSTVPASTLLVIAVLVYFRRKLNLPLGTRSAGVWQKLREGSNIVELTLCVYVASASSAVLLFTARYASLSSLSVEAAGFLQACLGIALSIGAVLGPANTLYFSPYVNRGIPAEEKIAAANRFLPRLVLLFCLGAILVMLYPQLVVRLLFSARFTPAAATLPFFVIWQCLYHIANVYQQLLLGLDDARGFGYITAVGNIVSAALCFLLVGRFGLLGIGFGFVAGALLIALLTGIRLHRKHRLTVPQSTPGLVAYAVAGLLAVALLGRYSAELSWPGFGARLLCTAIFAGGFWLVLPRALRTDIFAGAFAKIRALTQPRGGPA